MQGKMKIIQAILYRQGIPLADLGLPPDAVDPALPYAPLSIAGVIDNRSGRNYYGYESSREYVQRRSKALGRTTRRQREQGKLSRQDAR
jgi:hypothetical protein